MISEASLSGNGDKSIQNWKAESCHKPSLKQALKKLPADRQAAGPGYSASTG